MPTSANRPPGASDPNAWLRAGAAPREVESDVDSLALGLLEQLAVEHEDSMLPITADARIADDRDRIMDEIMSRPAPRSSPG